MARILVITNMYPPHHLGGYELLCQDVVKHWRASGHTVSILTTTFRNDDVQDPDDGPLGSVRRDLDFYYRDHQIDSPSLMKRIATERQNQAVLSRTLADVRPDVVSLWHMGAMSMGLISALFDRDVPCVFVLGDAWPIYGPDVDAWMRICLRRPGLARWARNFIRIPTTLPDTSRSGVFCFASDWLRREVDAKSRFAARYSPVIHHGIDTQAFAPRAHEHPWRWRLACAGRLDERKGFHVAVRAMQHLPDEAVLDIYGRGDERYRAFLRDLAERSGVSERVRFSSLTRQELAERYSSTDVLLFPTLWDEPFGLVPLEAMASGIPVLATPSGGSSEFLFDEANCLVVPRDDDRALAAAVLRLATEPDLRARVVRGGAATAQVFTVKRLASALEDWHLAAADRLRRTPADQPSAAEELRARGVLVR